jgi:hypothetical protein
MDIDIDVPLPEQIAAEDHDGQDDNGDDKTSDNKGQAGRRTFRRIICHGDPRRSYEYCLRNEGKQGFVPCHPALPDLARALDR